MDDNSFDLRRTAKWLGRIALGLLFIGCLVPAVLLELAFSLLFGWVAFLAHSFEENPLTGQRLIILGASLALILAARLFIGRQLRWPAARMMLGAAAAFLGAASGLALLNVAWQMAVLWQSPDPLYGVQRVQRRTQSVNNLREIAAGALAKGDAHRHPPFATFDDQGRAQHSWLTYLLPHVDRQDLFDRVRFDRPWSDPANSAVIGTPVQAYRIYYEPEQTAEGRGIAHYSLNARLVRPGQTLQETKIPDGAANTILAGEVIANVPTWAQPANWRDPAVGLNKSPHGFGSPHHGGLNVSLADGSVRFLDDDIDPAVLRALSTPTGGEPVDFDQLDR